MISSLSKLADKSFIVGFVMPALLAILALTALFPNLPWFGSLGTALRSSSNKLDDLALFVISVWVIAVLLSMTNIVQYRLLEGYLGPSRWRARRTASHQSIFDERQASLSGAYAAWAAAKTPAEKKKLGDDLSEIKRDLQGAYPSTKSDILPTRFGNVIRAFEVYPRDVYSIEAITGWTRLAAVLPRDFQAQIDDARSHVDFLVNLVFVAAGLAVCAFAKAIGEIAYGATLPSVDVALDLAVSIAAILLSYAAYLWAIDQAGGWGDLVKAAFDCYLPALAEQLGFPLPKDSADQRAFWAAFNQRVIYQDNATMDAWIANHHAPEADETAPACAKTAAAPAAHPNSDKADKKTAPDATDKIGKANTTEPPATVATTRTTAQAAAALVDDDDEIEDP